MTKQFFNPSPPYIMLMDVNSCFATLEQQANPLLRGKSVVVGAYTTDNGCVLAASREAKTYGIKTGMRVKDAKALYENVVVVSPDPAKYRFVNHQLQTILGAYSPDIEVKSIDEMIIDLAHSPSLKIDDRAWKMGVEDGRLKIEQKMLEIAKEIKRRIHDEVGEWITVSIGIAPNRYLAKVASNLTKPDGLHMITKENVEQVLEGLALEELPGIKQGYGRRLRCYGITTALAMYQSTGKLLKQALNSKTGYDWCIRLHGYEVDDEESETKSIGHSYAMKIAREPYDEKLHQILCQLTEKMARRMRSHHYRANGVHVSCSFADHTGWMHGEKQAMPLYAGDDLYVIAKRLLLMAPRKPVRILAVSCYALMDDLYAQQSLFEKENRKAHLMQAVDAIDNRWGDFSIFPGRMLAMEHKVLDRIAFGGVKEIKMQQNSMV